VSEGFKCVGEEQYRSACAGLDFYDEHEGKRYCVLHYPGEEKNKEDFSKVLESKLAQNDYNLGGSVFPEGTSDFRVRKFDANTNFSGATFVGEANFSGAQFNGEKKTDFLGAKFSGKKTDFSRAEFGGEQTNFSGAQFAGERTVFSGAQFGSAETYFLDAQFNGAKETDFSQAQFSSARTSFLAAQFSGAETYFRGTTFIKEVDFTAAIFKEKASFWGSKANQAFRSGAWARFNDCRIEKPGQFTFNTVLLHPCWFCNTDVRKVNFTDVKWYGMPGGPEGTLDREIYALKDRGVESPHTLLAQACRRLSANAEENHEYPLANEFHYWSMDALRREGWHRFGLIRTMY
jgi:uncharacterized protein YjbI with pentapeptide repeats